jgi:hypothetical protein
MEDNIMNIRPMRDTMPGQKATLAEIQTTLDDLVSHGVLEIKGQRNERPIYHYVPRDRLTREQAAWLDANVGLDL